MDVQKILKDWGNGATHGEIINKYRITREQEYSITLCSDGLNEAEIKQRLARVKPGMKTAEIRLVMQTEG